MNSVPASLVCRFEVSRENIMNKLITNYQQQKMDFLDNLQPDDLRNGESFNQMEMIIDNINQALFENIMSGKNPNEFINKSLNNLFRNNSSAKNKAIDLANVYLQMKQGTNFNFFAR